MNPIILAVIILSAIGLISGLGLSVASKFLLCRLMKKR